MLRAFSSLGCHEFDLDQTLALAGKHGMDGVELRALGGTVELPGYFAGAFGAPAGLAEKVNAQAVKVVGLGTSFKVVEDGAAAREKLLAYVPWAEALGGVKLRVFDGGKTADDAELARAGETMAWWRELRRERGWRTDLMVETHDSLFTAATIERFLAVAPGSAILWDTHHTWKKGGEDPLVTWRAIRGSVVHAHVKDSVSTAKGQHGWTYVLPGSGEFPMAPLREAWGGDGFAGPVSLEWERLWHPYLVSLDEALVSAHARGWW